MRHGNAFLVRPTVKVFLSANHECGEIQPDDTITKFYRNENLSTRLERVRSVSPFRKRSVVLESESKADLRQRLSACKIESSWSCESAWTERHLPLQVVASRCNISQAPEIQRLAQSSNPSGLDNFFGAMPAVTTCFHVSICSSLTKNRFGTTSAICGV